MLMAAWGEFCIRPRIIAGGMVRPAPAGQDERMPDEPKIDSRSEAHPRLRPPHFALAVEILDEVWRRQRPADAVLQECFRERPQMGSRDRAGVSELVYGVLRDFGRLRAIAG